MPGTLLKSIRNCNSYDSNQINRRILRRKLITKGFFGCSLRFTTGKNSGKIDKNNFAPQNGPGARCLWALTETGLENSPILEGNKLLFFADMFLTDGVREQPDIRGQ